jgi:uncharacterized membrane protein YdjX (TVP38/TMEM64 family)
VGRSRLIAVPVLAAAAVAAVLFLPHDPRAIVGAAHAAGPWALPLLLAAWVVGTPLLVPGTVLCAAAGLLFGPLGVAVSLLGSPLGALLAFGLGRMLGRHHLERRLPARLRPVVARLERSGARGVAVVRMAPGMPVCAFNYACGATRVRPRHFAVGSAVGAAPRVVLYGVLGGTIAHAGLLSAGIGAAVALAAALALLARRRFAAPRVA